MPFESVDSLQKTLAAEVFHYAADSKKAAGRALGTLVEVITFYALRAWNLLDHVVIERKVPEFANPEIMHNVEFSVHPIRAQHEVDIIPLSLPLTPAKIKRHLPLLQDMEVKANQVISTDAVKRNAAVLLESESGPVVANVNSQNDSSCRITVCELASAPFAILECKRVGVEEGMRKGPQTIEKAKQGAYVASTVSSLQKVRLRNGRFHGAIEQPDGKFRWGLYDDVIREAIDALPAAQIEGFILTVGVVSNHGNWFTSDNQNKELRVLAQSYDWLLFLTDAGLSQFIERLLLNPTPELAAARKAFLASYSGSSGSNRFTKVRMDVDADKALRRFFSADEAQFETWFNVITPSNATIDTLKSDLRKLAAKDW